jgi:hypothetical protein
MKATNCEELYEHDGNGIEELSFYRNGFPATKRIIY